MDRDARHASKNLNTDSFFTLPLGMQALIQQLMHWFLIHDFFLRLFKMRKVKIRKGLNKVLSKMFSAWHASPNIQISSSLVLDVAIKHSGQIPVCSDANVAALLLIKGVPKYLGFKAYCMKAILCSLEKSISCRMLLNQLYRYDLSNKELFPCRVGNADQMF